MTEDRKITRSLQCNLTQQEKVTYGEEMGAESQFYQEALDRKKDITKQLSAEVESHRAAMQRLGSLLANGYEYRQVECLLVIDGDLGMVRITRTDTGEVVENRQIRPDEMQAEMDV